MCERSIPPPAPATFLGFQECLRDRLPLALFRLTEPVGDHPVGSTVAHTTLEKHGYSVPEWILKMRTATQRQWSA